MPFVRIPNTVSVELVFAWDTQIVENVFHNIYEGSLNQGTLEAIHDIYELWYETALADIQSQVVGLNKIVVKDQNVQNGLGIEFGPGEVFAGTIASTPSLPNNVTLALKWGTGFTGRSYRGRTYHIGLVEGLVTLNNVPADSLAQIISTYDELRQACDSAGYPLVVVSKFANNAPRALAITTPVTTVTSDGVIDSQRRRLPGRGQ